VPDADAGVASAGGQVDGGIIHVDLNLYVRVGPPKFRHNPDGLHYVKTREAHGYEALETRIVGSYEKNVRDGGNRFRAAKNAQALRGLVTFNWEMVTAGGDVAAVGLEFLVLDNRGRIVTDYQFIVS